MARSRIASGARRLPDYDAGLALLRWMRPSAVCSIAKRRGSFSKPLQTSPVKLAVAHAFGV